MVAFTATLLSVVVSPGVETRAAFVVVGYAAAATVTVSFKLLLARGRSGPGLVQVTVCASAEQVQLAPAQETNPSPVGSSSVTTMGPVVGPPRPRFLTLIV